MPDIVVLVGNPRPGSRTRAVAEQVADLVRAALADAGHRTDAVRTLELADIVAVGLGREPVAPARPTPDALDAVRSADVLLVATPSYKGTFTGLLKVFCDQLPHAALADTVAVPVTVAGSPGHLDSTGAALAALLGELGARVAGAVRVLDASIGADGGGGDDDGDGDGVAGQARRVAAAVVAAVDAADGDLSRRPVDECRVRS